MLLSNYAALTKNKIFANVLLGKLPEKKRKETNFEFDILTTSVKNIVTYVQYENWININYTMWFNTSSLMLSAVMKIAGNSNNYPWGLIREWGLICQNHF